MVQGMGAPGLLPRLNANADLLLICVTPLDFITRRAHPIRLLGQRGH